MLNDIKQGKSEGFDSCDWLSNLTQIGLSVDFSARVTLKFDGWPRKIIRHVSYTTSSFVHHFKSISEFKLELQSGNTQSGSNSTIFFSRVTLKLDEWPWKKTIAHIFYATSKFCASFRSHWWIQTGVTVRKRLIWVKIDNFFSCATLQFDVWPWKTIGCIRLPLLCYFKLCASFRSHWWIQTGVTVRKRLIWVKFDDFFRAVWRWNLTDDLEKQ